MTAPRRLGGVLAAALGLLGAGAARADPAAGPIAIARPLDAAKGLEAVAAFRKITARYCAGQDTDEDTGPPGQKRPLVAHWSYEAQELDRVDWRGACPPFPSHVEAIASGSFTKLGMEEVVLVVANGKDRATGEYSLALMGKDDRYRLRRVMMRGQGFRASARVKIPGSVDALFLCERGGAQGEYRGTCGFFGRGTFRSPGRPTSPVGFDPFRRDSEKYAERNELSLRSVVQCGPSWAVELGKVAARGERLMVQLVVETMVNEAAGESDECTRRVGKRRREFEVVYQIDGRGLHRVSRIPRVVRQTLAKE